MLVLMVIRLDKLVNRQAVDAANRCQINSLNQQ
jgi:hypothetical protein